MSAVLCSAATEQRRQALIRKREYTIYFFYSIIAFLELQFVSKDGATETAPGKSTFAQLSSPALSQLTAMYALRGRETSGYSRNQLILVRDARGKISKRIGAMR